MTVAPGLHSGRRRRLDVAVLDAADDLLKSGSSAVPSEPSDIVLSAAGHARDDGDQHDDEAIAPAGMSMRIISALRGPLDRRLLVRLRCHVRLLEVGLMVVAGCYTTKPAG